MFEMGAHSYRFNNTIQISNEKGYSGQPRQRRIPIVKSDLEKCTIGLRLDESENKEWDWELAKILNEL